ncbi:MAG: hypothetical protein WAW85_09745 [Gordonia sp. (in: high G+C Gram-positive bacteria)]|uniref:hypothetical protein n=1 Tax=Gordonia sp. (in: high G+C Gram-positive bacteria) TaxID=84139 RepID=UPI003BB71CE1
MYQAYLIDAPPGARVQLIDGAGASVGSGQVDRLGSFLVRELRAGEGYRFVVAGKPGNTFAVRDESAPDRVTVWSSLSPSGSRWARPWPTARSPP